MVVPRLSYSDAVMRVEASDIPSLVSLHYAGKSEGPVFEFGFDMNEFAVESENLEFSHPAMNICRTVVLDYFRDIEKRVRPDRRVFCFEAVSLSAGDHHFLSQICLSMGFPVSESARYLSGENMDFQDNFPELGLFRDIVFLFHLMTQPSSDSLPEVRRWKPVHAALKWKIKTNNEKKVSFSVHGFGRSLSWKPRKKRVRRNSIFSGIFGTSNPRRPPSAADPKNLVGKNVETEDDILHLQKLPTFEGKNQAQMPMERARCFTGVC